MHLSFTDRTYLVSGGGSGIGKGVAAGLVRAGADVVIIGRNSDRLSAAAEQIGAGSPARVLARAADVTDEDQVADVVAAAEGWNGRLHGVVHCAGVRRPSDRLPRSIRRHGDEPWI